MFNLGRWESLRASGPFAFSGNPTFAGISGGRTSAMMAALLDDRVGLCFANTGREHPRTLDFLNELDARLGNRLVWLEFRKPRVKGASPRMFEFARISYATADRSGGPFEAFMEATNDFRAAKGEDIVTPWSGGRICTRGMKHRVIDAYVRSIGVGAHDRFVGLRADEPGRVWRLEKESTRRRRFFTPLFAVGITKANVSDEFWPSQDFDLGLRDNQGNCTGCFLKDQTDLARVLAEPETDAAWWIAMQDRWHGFGGFGHAGYRQLAAETEMRLSIERVLRDSPAMLSRDTAAKDVAVNLSQLCSPAVSRERFRLVVIQERKRLWGEIPAFSCSCEASMGVDDEDDDEQLSFDFGDAA